MCQKHGGGFSTQVRQNSIIANTKWRITSREYLTKKRKVKRINPTKFNTCAFTHVDDDDDVVDHHNHKNKNQKEYNLNIKSTFLFANIYSYSVSGGWIR